MTTSEERQSGKPLLSIMIPTKNRHETAVACVIEAIKAGPASEIEIVVQDCSDNKTLEELLRNHNLISRVVYHHVAYPVSMTENWNLGMVHLTGEYLIIIGDDDAVLPSILEVARWASERQYSAVKAKQTPFYCWPDFADKRRAGQLILKPFTGRWGAVETVPLLRRFCKTGDEYQNFPCVYHNLVKRSVLDQIYVRSGRYFDGLSPDIYAAYAIAVAVESFAIVDYPITIMGASARSNTNRTPTGQGHLHFTEFKEYHFSSITPSSWGLYASNADNLVKASTNLDRQDLLSSLDLSHVFARTIVAEPRRAQEHFRKYVRAMRELDKCLPLAVLALLGKVIGKVALNVLGRLRPSAVAVCGETVSGVESISAAVDIQERWLLANRVLLDLARSQAEKSEAGVCADAGVPLN